MIRLLKIKTRLLVIFVTSSFFRLVFNFFLKNENLWVMDRSNPHLIVYSGRIQSVEIREPIGGRMMLVAVCIGSGGSSTFQLDRREITLGPNIRRLNKNTWSIPE